jgi:nucleoside-diphosphate-sugar epimerase
VARLAAEKQWLEMGQNGGTAVQLFRLSGIYGPGRNALVNLREGTARRIDKPGQVFNRIHVADIAGAVAASMNCALGAGPAPSIVNVTDDAPCPPQDVGAHGARLMGLTLPPLIPFSEAALSPMGRSFYGENKRVSNRLLRETLGYRLAFPTYREGLDALWQEMQ